MRSTTRFKHLLAQKRALTLPGAANAMFARVVEDLGFEACYVSGAGIANMHLGAPDIGLTTLTEIANAVSAISDAIKLPLMVDGDTGFGNAVNMHRTIKVLERAGAAAIQIEDQVFPKKCGHFNGKEVIPCAEMVAKIKAAILVNHGALDKALAGGWPAQEAELKKNNIRYEGHIWPNSVHGFFNDATPERYNKVTAPQAWARMIEWFNMYSRDVA